MESHPRRVPSPGANEVSPLRMRYKGTRQRCKEAEGSVLKNVVRIAPLSTWQCWQVVRFTSRPPRSKVQRRQRSRCSHSRGLWRKAAGAGSTWQQGYFEKRAMFSWAVSAKGKTQAEQSTSSSCPRSLSNDTKHHLGNRDCNQTPPPANAASSVWRWQGTHAVFSGSGAAALLANSANCTLWAPAARSLPPPHLEDRCSHTWDAEPMQPWSCLLQPPWCESLLTKGLNLKHINLSRGFATQHHHLPVQNIKWPSNHVVPKACFKHTNAAHTGCGVISSLMDMCNPKIHATLCKPFLLSVLLCPGGTMLAFSPPQQPTVVSRSHHGPAALNRNTLFWLITLTFLQFAEEQKINFLISYWLSKQLLNTY